MSNNEDGNKAQSIFQKLGIKNVNVLGTLKGNKNGGGPQSSLIKRRMTLEELDLLTKSMMIRKMERETARQSWIRRIDIDFLLQKLVLMPDSNFYLFWTEFIGFLSIVQALAYTSLIIFRFSVDILDQYVIASMVFVELSFVLNIIIESFKAYDNDQELNEFITDWKKTTRKFWGSVEFKIQMLNLFPFGALGFIHEVSWMRILWLLKIFRIKFFRNLKYDSLISILKKIMDLRHHPHSHMLNEAKTTATRLEE